jgi:hypothetical protein
VGQYAIARLLQTKISPPRPVKTVLSRTIYNNVRLNLTSARNKKVVVFSSNLSITAGNIMISDYRMAILEALGQVENKLDKNVVIQICLFPAARFASE